MKKTIVLLFGLLLMLPAVFGQSKAGKKDTANHISLYTCPTHPGIVTGKAGTCRICGMALNLSKKELLKSQVTKAYTCPIHADVVSNKSGKCPKCGTSMNLSLKEKMKAETVKVYTCSMHPDVTSKKPGKCPKCGMDMGEKKGKDAGYLHD